MTSLAGRMIRLPLRAVPRGAVVRVLSGANRGARWVVGASSHGCWLGTYEPETQRAVAALAGPGRVFYDIGANVGFYTVLAARRGATVHAFEPEPHNLTALYRHVALNGGQATIHPVAVSDRNGWSSFDGHGATGHLADRGRVLVRTVTLDDLTIPPPDAMKIDVEGAELAVLRGAQRTIEQHRPAIVLGLHGKMINGENVDRGCFALLGALGYAHSRLGADGWLFAAH